MVIVIVGGYKRLGLYGDILNQIKDKLTAKIYTTQTKFTRLDWPVFYCPAMR